MTTHFHDAILGYHAAPAASVKPQPLRGLPYYFKPDCRRLRVIERDDSRGLYVEFIDSGVRTWIKHDEVTLDWTECSRVEAPETPARVPGAAAGKFHVAININVLRRSTYDIYIGNTLVYCANSEQEANEKAALLNGVVGIVEE